jgi:RNA 3'-terminal phosphate cyclase (ATP)
MGLIKIDGSYGEGGGQIIRTCLSLSAITGKPVEITNIRAGRSKAGLQPQHLAAVNAVGDICGATLKNAAIGSARLTFEPRTAVASGDYRIDIGTAGATVLVLQALMLPLSLADGPSTVEVTGGTHVPHAPPAEYLQEVYLLALKDAGFAVRTEYGGAGFFPKGGGKVNAVMAGGAAPTPFAYSRRGNLHWLRAYVVTAVLPDHVATRGVAAIERFMKGIGRKVDIVTLRKQSSDPGAAVIITAQCEEGLAGFTSLGQRGKPMEKVSEEACVEFVKWWNTGAACDERLGDQLVLPASLIEGESIWAVPRVTEHLQTVLWVVQQFLPIKYKVNEMPDGHTLVRVRGAGLTPS